MPTLARGPSGRPRAAGSVRLVYGVLALGGGAVILRPGLGETIGPLTVLTGFLATGLALLRKSLAIVGRERTAWMAIGCGFLTASLGMLTYGIGDAVAGPLPAFGPIDLLFLGGYALALGGFAFLPHQAPRVPERVKTYLDGLITAMAVGVVAWVLFLDEMLHALREATGWERWVGSAYPLLDVSAFAVLVVITTRRSALRFDPRLLWFGLGLAAHAVADVLYLQRGIGSTFEEARPYFPAFILAAACYFTAAVLLDHNRRPREYADRPAAIWGLLGPYALAVVALLAASWRIAVTALDESTRSLLRMLLVLVVLVIVSQAVAIHENGRVVTRQRMELVASVSHELRTPLTSIVGYLELLDDPVSGLGDDERKELTSVARHQAHFMAGLVSDLIQLGQEGTQTITLLDRREDVAALVAAAVDATETGSVRVTVDVSPGLEAHVDRRRLQQVVVNLVSNAARYGGGAALVTARAVAADLVLEVHDDGPGVPRKWELAIWDRFERGEYRFDARVGGSGLGLAVVQDIARAYRGTSGYTRSATLGGACFRVVIPGCVVAPSRAIRRALDLAPVP